MKLKQLIAGGTIAGALGAAALGVGVGVANAAPGHRLRPAAMARRPRITTAGPADKVAQADLVARADPVTTADPGRTR